MQQRSGKHYLEAKRQYMDTGKLGKVTLARTWWHGNSYHLRKAPASLQTQPANLDWAHFLGPLKWRDWDPQQYWNWRAYLDFGGGQVTDLFTHWIDVVHMFMGQDNPICGVGGGRRLQLQGRPHRARHHQRAAGIPVAVHGHVRSHAGSRHHRGRRGVVRHRGPPVDRSLALRIPPDRAATRNPPWCRRRATWTWITSRTSWSACARANCPTATCSSGTARRRRRTWATSRTCRSGASISTRSARRFCRSDGLLY